MKFYMKIIVLLVSLAGYARAQVVIHNPAKACQQLGGSVSIPDVTVNFAEYLPAGTNITLTQAYNLSSCGYISQVVSNDICRVAMYVATSHRSGVLGSSFYDHAIGIDCELILLQGLVLRHGYRRTGQEDF